MTPSPPTIRARTDADLDQLAQLLIDVHSTDGYPVEGVADPRAWLMLGDPLGAWIAEIDQRIVGHVALMKATDDDDAARVWSRHSGTPLSGIAVLCRLFVSPEHRGHRLGLQLTQAATAAAHAVNRTPVLDVMAKDAAAIRLYESLGWTVVANISHQHSGHLEEPASVYRGPLPPE